MRNALVALGLSCWLSLPEVTARAVALAASEAEPQHAEHSAMTYVGAVLANLVYFPTKAVFAQVGAITSGLVYVVTLGDTRTTNTVWDTTTGGNYVVTPSMLEGKEMIHFTGEY